MLSEEKTFSMDIIFIFLHFLKLAVSHRVALGSLYFLDVALIEQFKTSTHSSSHGCNIAGFFQPVNIVDCILAAKQVNISLGTKARRVSAS